ncbi:tRNA pseudouridine synthase B [Tepidamorphus gemmatus]|uniref:tRNA pseudouridine synthase B n=1 Tax=Tepidamorphus gemmatus TaxID=747076 RepID=A0A4R3MER0_9HYPH|nr:tRNA pseudouridine(55) synthase TruB [Tepidamorphus gemmatus]TCT11986.1 tRNA pseudouridine synthase B [Tepidamorphus gemmatus]
MGRRARQTDLHGWVVLDKPVGMTSTQAVGRIKRLFRTRKAGHAGTLDPLASGCLPVALGEATKTVPFVVDGLKVYRFTVRWGAETDTDDSEGRVIATSDLRPADAAIDAVLPRFIGLIEQVPPRFSAIKIDGERAYDLARGGEAVELAPRHVEVLSLARTGPTRDRETEFECECGKGTYVRSLARDIARALGGYGHVSALRRLAVGPFGEDDMISLDKLQELCDRTPDRDPPVDALRPVETALDDIPALAISQSDATRLRNGQPVLLRGRDAPVLSGPAYTTTRGRLVALVEADRGELHPRRVFNLPG